MAERGPDKDRVIDALVLAISNSELAGITGSDALRSVLRVEYHDMVEGNVLDMALLWELLEEQPGFEAQAAKPPLALVKAWESRLELEIQLPPAMADMDDRDRAMAAAKCRVPPAELKLLFRMQTGELPRDTPSQSPGRTTVPLPSNTSGRHQRLEDKKHRPAWMGWLAIVLALGGFGVAGYTGYQQCGGGEWSSFDTSMLGELQAKGASRLGTQLTVTINGSAWLKLDKETRQKQLKVALLQVEERGIEVITLTAGGRTLATVQRAKSGKLVFWPAD